MIAATIFVLSIAALAQLGLFYWRAMIAGVAAEPLSDRVRAVTGVTGNTFSKDDFSSIVSLHEICPELGKGGGGVLAVRIYYRIVVMLDSLFGSRSALLSTWANHEMATCSRYVAVKVDQCLERNFSCFAQIRS